MKQLSLPFAKDISDKDLKLFKVCNSANRYWVHKRQFYEFKNELLQKYGHENGYDLQIIKRTCHNCGGTAKHWNGHDCWQCCAGIHHIEYVLLKRYLLNGELFHCFETVTSDNYTRVNRNTIYQEYSYINVIEGLIKHDAFEYNETIALAELYFKYDKQLLQDLIIFYAKAQRTKALYKWRQIIGKFGATVETLREYFGFKKQLAEVDDLPF